MRGEGGLGWGGMGWDWKMTILEVTKFTILLTYNKDTALVFTIHWKV